MLIVKGWTLESAFESALESVFESADYGSESVGSNTGHGPGRFEMQ